MWLTNSSVGRKLVMAITGACLVLFVTFHCLMNSVAILWPGAYNAICEFLGANWYALIASAGLALLFILHIIYAVWLTIQNRKARGNDRYAVTARPKGVEWSSRNMLVLGIVILAFLVLHLVQFWAKMQLAEICGHHEPNPANGIYFINVAFACWITPVAYIIGFIALWFHMTHGFWSMFHTCGWDNDIWINRLKCIGNWWTSIVVALFIAQAVVFTVRANNACECDCPVSQEWNALVAQEDGASCCCAAEEASCCAAAEEEHACCGKCQEGNCEEGKCCKNEEGKCCGNCEEGNCQCGEGECQSPNCENNNNVNE